MACSRAAMGRPGFATKGLFWGDVVYLVLLSAFIFSAFGFGGNALKEHWLSAF